jgi:hypothetical protein
VSPITHLFPTTYEQSRDRFRGQLARLRIRWPDAGLHQHALKADPALTLDWIRTGPAERGDRLLILTSGQHGIEGFVGSAMLQMFLETFLDLLKPTRTALLLIHAINPWGMKHRRRTNAANVDLNRNFVHSLADFDATFNPAYGRLDPLLNPVGPLGGRRLHGASFWPRFLGALLALGPTGFRTASLQGQYRWPQGLYYGGEAFQEETRVVIDLYRRHIRTAGQVVHVDMHTGYGPRDQMTLVNSRFETRPSSELMRTFGYPRIARATEDEFYPMQGDMIDFVYTLRREEAPTIRLYAGALEFGTLGESLPATLLSLRTMIRENQAHRFGTDTEHTRQQVLRAFDALFAPEDPSWRAKAVADARQAFQGILAAEGYLAA